MGKYKSWKKKKLFWLLVSWTIIVALAQVQTLVHHHFFPGQYEQSGVFTFQIATYVVGSILIIFWVLPGYYFIRNRKNWLKIMLFIVHGVSFSFLYLILLFLIFGLLLSESTFDWYLEQIRLAALSGFHNIIKSYLFLVSLLFAFDYFESKTQALILKKNTENELNEAKLATLKAKLQPHFLFNSLNSIVALMDENIGKAQKALINLGDLLRYSINFKPKAMIPIFEEVELLKKFLVIEKSRHEHQLVVEWKFDTKENSFDVPAMILQPLVENSIKHGFKGLDRSLRIIIEVLPNEKLVIIKNDGNRLSGPIKEGVGLQLVRQRLKHHFPNSSHFEIYQENEWVCNKISFT